MTRNKALTLYGAYKDGKDVMPLLGRHPNIVDMGGNRHKEEKHSEHEEHEHAAGLDEKTAKEWVAGMVNPEDPSRKGEHWSMAQTSQVLKQLGYSFDTAEWYAVMNMMYSDYYHTAKKYGQERNAEFFADMAKDWLDDKDTAAGKHKTEKYYRKIVV